jgi:hypothetical protein
MIYRVSSSKVKVTQRNPVSKRKEGGEGGGGGGGGGGRGFELDS